MQFCNLLCIVISNLLCNSICQQSFDTTKPCFFTWHQPIPWFFILFSKMKSWFYHRVMSIELIKIQFAGTIASFLASNDCWQTELKRRFEITTHKRLQKCISISNKKYRPVKSINSAGREKTVVCTLHMYNFKVDRTQWAKRSGNCKLWHWFSKTKIKYFWKRAVTKHGGLFLDC